MSRLTDELDPEELVRFDELDAVQAAAEEQARLEAIARCVDLDEESPEAAIEQLRREADDDQPPPAWRRSS